MLFIKAVRGTIKLKKNQEPSVAGGNKKSIKWINLYKHENKTKNKASVNLNNTES